jgi:hypothetical protein
VQRGKKWMNLLNSLEYRQAFNNYLRRGTPIRSSLKAEDLGHPTTHYIWRTRGDPQVRPSHIENNGKLFAWDSPTGNRTSRGRTMTVAAQRSPMNAGRANMLTRRSAAISMTRLRNGTH